MPAYSNDRQKLFVTMIRTLLVRNGDMTDTAMRDALAKQGVDLDREYIAKLRHKIARERAERMNHVLLNDELAKYADMLAVLADRLWDIILDANTLAKDRTAAMKEMRQARESLLDKQFDAGVFERQLGKVKVERELSDEQKVLVATALEYALKPRHAIPRIDKKIVE